MPKKLKGKAKGKSKGKGKAKSKGKGSKGKGKKGKGKKGRYFNMCGIWGTILQFILVVIIVKLVMDQPRKLFLKNH